MPHVHPLATLAQTLRDFATALQPQPSAAAPTVDVSSLLRDILPNLPTAAELRTLLPTNRFPSVNQEFTVLRTWGAGITPPSPARLSAACLRLAQALEDATGTPPPAMPTPPPALPTLTSPRGDWRLMKKLGQGGQGTAYLAQRDAPEVLRGVAKRLRSKHGDPPTAKAIERFRREVAIIEKLHHPCIVGILDQSEDPSEPWVVLEHVPLGSLHDHLAVFRGDVFRVLRLGRDLASALLAAHQKGVIHRDVKPANNLLRSLDQAVLSDFGIAHDEDEATVTSTDELVRARWYGPPEAEHGRVDHPEPSFDVYMLGKVLYITLSGDPWQFPREDFASAKSDLRSRLQRPELSAFNDLLAKMIVAAPTDRLQTMEAVIQAIDHTWLRLASAATP